MIGNIARERGLAEDNGGWSKGWGSLLRLMFHPSFDDLICTVK